MLPCARQDGLAVQDLVTETVVYDLERHRAHTLNHTATLVWQCCDGETSIPDIARKVALELDRDVDEQLVWLALERLEHAGLLREKLERPALLSRRDLASRLRLVGALSLLLPVVTSVVAPTPARAGLSCTPFNSTGCSTLPCCPGSSCVGDKCI